MIFSAGGTEDTPGRHCGGRGGRPLSELMRLHAEKGTDVTFTTEEASRVADVLKQWVGAPFIATFATATDKIHR